MNRNTDSRRVRRIEEVPGGTYDKMGFYNLPNGKGTQLNDICRFL